MHLSSSHHLNSQLLFMASSSIFHILLLILFYILLSTQPTSSGRVPARRKQTGFRAPLTRVSSSKATTKNPLEDSLVTTRMTAYKDIYVMNVSIGTPPVEFSAMMDTGSNLIWTKCIPSSSRFFDPTKSISFSLLTESCKDLGLDPDCIQSYEDGLDVSITLGQEILTIGNTKIQDLRFACGKPYTEDFKYNGIVGMGPGDLSLISQSEESIFSYCLGSRFDPEMSSVLLTGSEASTDNADVQTTPLASDKLNYYITLEGISVGQTKLAVTKSDFPTSNGYAGRMVIDSGTTFTYLDTHTLEMISNEFANQTKLEKYTGDNEPYYRGLEHCFNAPGNVQIPNLVFHFEGAEWELPRENYIYQQQGKDMVCLAFIAEHEQFTFGNMQQQNMLVIYDLDNNILSFKRAACNEL